MCSDAMCEQGVRGRERQQCFTPICACTVSWGTILPILLSFAARLVANSVFGEYSADAAVIFSPLL
jgi:hypothetical protein